MRALTLLLLVPGLAIGASALEALNGDANVAAQESQTRDIERAKARFRVGKQAFDEERFDDAAQAFLDAYRFSGRSELLFNVAQSFRRAGHLQKAADYFQQYLEERPDAPNADAVVEAIIAVQEEMDAQMATVDVQTSPPGLNIFVNGELTPRCQSPCTVSLLPGEHTLVAREPNGGEISDTLTVAAKQQTSLRLEVAPQVQLGQLEVTTDVREGTISINGQAPVQLPMLAPVELPAGSHQLTVRAADRVWRGTVDVPPNDVRRILVPLGGIDGSSINTVQLTSIGLASSSVGLFLGAALLGRAAGQTHAALEDQQASDRPVDAGMVDRGKSQKTAANVLYGAGAATLSAGVGLYVWDMLRTSDASDSQAQPEPTEPQESSADVDLLGLR